MSIRACLCIRTGCFFCGRRAGDCAGEGVFRTPGILKNKTTAYKNMVSALLLGLDCGILLNGYLSKPLVFSAAAPIVTGLVRVCGWERRAAAGRGAAHRLAGHRLRGGEYGTGGDRSCTKMNLS